MNGISLIDLKSWNIIENIIFNIGNNAESIVRDQKIK